MRETIEFRVPVEYAAMHLPPGLGENLGLVRKIVLPSDDPLVARIGQLQRLYASMGKAFFHGWMVHRKYSRRELREASVLYVWPRSTFQPAGEECGTVYDDAGGCTQVLDSARRWDVRGHDALIPASTCGAGARQVTPLFLSGRRIPKNVDFARTIAGEVVVSSRVVHEFGLNRLRGGAFEAVRLSDEHGATSEHHYQLNIAAAQVDVDPITRAGEDPFDEHSYGRCPCNHVLGLNLLSEVTVKQETIPRSDIMATRQLVGVRRGLLRPRALILVSASAFRVIEDAKLKGLVIEVAHVV